MQHRCKELVWLVLLALVLGAQAMRAQTESELFSPEQADKFFQAQEWGKAATAYEEIAKREPSNGQAWLRLGVARHNLKQYTRAIAA
jgi:tetratricopeptide (TPR) repeat protein